jgi:hypothetical protein
MQMDHLGVAQEALADEYISPCAEGDETLLSVIGGLEN